jgi:hypothetical protein
VGEHWTLAYTTKVGQPLKMELEASVTGEEVLTVAGQEIKTQRIEFEGYTDRNPSMHGMYTGRYRATAWYSPELGRLVRFEVRSRGGTSTGQYTMEEALELTAIR